MNAIGKRLSGSRKRIAAQYSSLDGEHQAVFLACLADQLSLRARGTYDGGSGVADSARLRAFNEAQNRVLAQLVRVLTSDAHRYPDDVFANVLVDQCQMLGIDPEQMFRTCLGAPSGRALERVATDAGG